MTIAIGTIQVRLSISISLSLPLAVVDAVSVGGVGASSIAIMSSIATIEKVRISISLGLGLSLPLAVVVAGVAKTIGTIVVRLSLSLRLGKSHGDQGKESNSFHLDVSPTKELRISSCRGLSH